MFARNQRSRPVVDDRLNVATGEALDTKLIKSHLKTRWFDLCSANPRPNPSGRLGNARLFEYFNVAV